MKQLNITLTKYESEIVRGIDTIDTAVVTLTPEVTAELKYSLIALLDITRLYFHKYDKED